LVRPQGWIIFVAIFLLTVANIVVTEMRDAAQQKQLTVIQNSAANTQAALEAASKERMVEATIAGMLDETAVQIEQARIRATNDVARNSASSNDMKLEYVRLSRESLGNALAIIDRYETLVVNEYHLTRPQRATDREDPLTHLEFVRGMLRGEGHPNFKAPAKAFPLLESLCTELTTGLNELAARYRQQVQASRIIGKR
jgi:hypothetical protein